MKKLFSGFYSPTNDEIKASWLDGKTLFVFDTNVLLNLYAYTKITREDFFKIIEKVSDNIWLPYHVGLEYQRNRLNVVKNEKGIFNDIEKYVKSIEKQINNADFNNLKLKQRLPDLFNSSVELHTKIEELLSKYRDSVKKWNNQQPDVRSSDLIRKKIDELFDDKVGNPFEQEKLDEISKEGKERYDNKIPPGYKDKKEKEKADKFTYQGLTYIPMYGDLIIWKQIIEKAKDENIESVIFVTDDVKEDWVYSLDSNGIKEIGVRAELREEIYRESKISSFELLTTTDFMQNGKEFLELSEVHEESIAEAKSNVEDRKEKKKVKDDSSNFQVNRRFDPRKKLLEEYYKGLPSYEKNLLVDNIELEDAVKKLYELDNKTLYDNMKDYENRILDNTSIMNSFILCPCGSGKLFSNCCR